MRDIKQPVSYEFFGQKPQNKSNLENYAYRNSNTQIMPNSYQVTSNIQPANFSIKQPYQV